MTKSLHRLLGLSLLLALPTASSAQTGARELSLEQQTKMADAITRDAGAPLPGARFSLAIGSAVPADVPLRAVPGSLDAVAPEFRGASYVVVEEQIAIVDTGTRKILAVIQRGLSQTDSAPAKRQ
jgi:Protein of unknown function (DUF1236)